MDGSERKKVNRTVPHPKSYLRIDPDNAYKRLGVSPLISTDEIATRISDLRGKAAKSAKAKGHGEAEIREIERLDKIAKEIGDDKERVKYDEAHPVNVLLTVQPSRSEKTWSRYLRAGVASEWLCEVLGDDAFIPSLRCVTFWAPSGLDPNLKAFLLAFDSAEAGLDSPAYEQATVSSVEETVPLRASELERLKELDNG